jgi:polyphenol oxidase
MAAALGVARESLITAYQIHSSEVVVAQTPWSPQARPRADAIVTRVPGIAVGISTADCGPVLLADAEARVVGAAHAGWRGALAGITDAAIVAMERLGAQRDHIVAALGPMIRQQNYEVGADLIAQFRSAEPANERFFRPAARPGHALFDLPGYVASRLARAGIARIEDLAACTYADASRFYSFRRTTHLGEADYGRHVNAIALA